MTYQAWIANETRVPFVKQSPQRGELGPEEVEIAVEHCGVRHSDLSVWQNEWGTAVYPAVLGHEAVGRVTAIGPAGESRQRGAASWRRLE